MNGRTSEMAGGVEMERSGEPTRGGWIAPALWIAVFLLLAPIVAGAVVELIPGSGSLGSAPGGYIVIGMIIASCVELVAIAQVIADHRRATIHPAVATLAALGLLLLAGSVSPLLFTAIGLSVVAAGLVLLSAALARFGPRQARAPALIAAVTVIGVALLLLGNAP